MRSMTAAEVTRDAATVLAAVEAGETIIVTRDGMPIARFAPERGNTAARIDEVMARFPVDPAWPDDLEQVVRDLRAEPADQETSKPDD